MEDAHVCLFIGSQQRPPDPNIVQLEVSSGLLGQWEHAHVGLFTGIEETPVITIQPNLMCHLVYQANGGMHMSLSLLADKRHL